MYLSSDNSFPSVRCGDPRMKEQIKPRRVLGCKNGKTRLYRPSLPHVVTINGFQVLLSSPPTPSGEDICLTHPAPHPIYVPHPISKWPARPLSHSLYPGYKSGLRTPVQRWFSLELACCSNGISHSNKLYFSLIMSHVWKFFSNLRPDHNTWGRKESDMAKWLSTQ